MVSLNTYRIDVVRRNQTLTDNQWVKTAHQLGITALTGCHEARVFFVMGNLSEDDLALLTSELLADPVTENATIHAASADLKSPQPDTHIVEVTLQPGVTDPAAENLVRAASNLDISLKQAATARHYELTGALQTTDLHALATRVLANPVIQRYTIDRAISAPFIEPHEGDGLVETIALRGADDNELLAISQERRLSLDLQEMYAVQAWYQDEGRDPTDIELEMVAQTWSEHCVHKTFKALIHFQQGDHFETVDGLINQYIRAATEIVNKPWVYSAFVDNAGIVAFNDQYDLAFKVETHNHPSALEPFGGANTGVGGVVRDVLGVSAKPIANTDILCFGPQDLDESQLPEGVLHPRRIQAGVVHGIEDYGNKMGIPTVNGAVMYHRGYTANPLVFCGCLGLLPHGSHRTEPQAGDYIVVLGGRTGRDGLRGATFSSIEMDTSTSEIASISVQIGHPINEKQVQEVILRARDEGLYSAITDCGAGGLSSAVGEMGEHLGADVQLQHIPLKYPGLRPWEIWLSEAQERMVMAVPAHHWERLQQIADGQDVEVTMIGTYGTKDQRLILRYGDVIVGDVSMALLHECLPRREMQAMWTAPEEKTPTYLDVDIRETLLKLLAHPNIRSKEDIVRRYDHEVQGGMSVKPFVGVDQHVGGDSSVIVPPFTQQSGSVRGVALSVGVCPQYTALDPYAMAWAAVDEAFRNLVAVGADPDQVALLDNFSWGNPNLPDRLGSLVLAAKGCHDAAVAYNAPFVSGKDSLNNEYADADGTRHAIPGTLVISALGIVPDVTKTVTMDVKAAGNYLVSVGDTLESTFGGSHFHMIREIEGGAVPQPNENGLSVMRAVHRAIQAGLVQSCHDVSEGGIAVALTEMCIAGRFGAEMVNWDYAGDGSETAADIQRRILFAENNSQFIIEVKPDDFAIFEALLTEHNVAYDTLAEVTKDQTLKLAHFDGTTAPVVISLSELESAYRGDPVTAVAPDVPQTPAREQSKRSISAHTDKPRVLILHANGTNRDHDAALACELAGGTPEIVHINQLLSNERHLLDYHMLVVPGGFSYGDDLGAGQLWAQDLRHKIRDDLKRFAQDGRPVLGICNGFQVLLKSGLLPNTDFATGNERKVTLTYNENGQFECRWVYLKPNPQSTSLFTEGMDNLILCPIAHGEGRVMTRDADTTQQLWSSGQVALTYVDADGAPVAYPGNPNGSVTGIAALSNPEGNVMGLMPHPENHIFPWQHPRFHRGAIGQSGLVLFKNGVSYA